MERWSHMGDGPHGRKPTWDRAPLEKLFAHVIPMVHM